MPLLYMFDLSIFFFPSHLKVHAHIQITLILKCLFSLPIEQHVMSVVSFYYYSTLQSFRSTDPHWSDLSDFPVLVIFQGSQKGRFPLPPYSALRVKALNILIHFERDYPDLSIMSFLTNKFLSTKLLNFISFTSCMIPWNSMKNNSKTKNVAHCNAFQQYSYWILL